MAEIFVPVRRKYMRFVFMQIWEILFPFLCENWETRGAEELSEWYVAYEESSEN